MNTHQSKKQLAVIAAILGVGIALALLILFARPAPVSGASSQEPAVEKVAQGTVHLTDAQVKAAGITILTAAPATIDSTLTLPGDIRFNDDRTAQVVPLLGGTVQAVQAHIGQAVTKGQVLALVASAELSDQRSVLRTAEQRLALAQTTFAREKALWDEKISAEQDVIQARHALQEAQIDQDNAQQKLRAVGASRGAAGKLASYALRAPFDGEVVAQHIVPGQSVRPDSVLFTIADTATVWVDVAVPAGDLGQVRAGADVTVKASASDAKAAGKVAYIGAMLGTQTRTAVARIVLANPDRAWRPGMFVNVDVATSAASAVAVAVDPAAVQTVEDKPTVFVRVPGGFAARHVTLGRADAAHVEVKAGLAPGQAYAGAGSYVIKAELGKSSDAGHH